MRAREADPHGALRGVGDVGAHEVAEAQLRGRLVLVVCPGAHARALHDVEVRAALAQPVAGASSAPGAGEHGSRWRGAEHASWIGAASLPPSPSHPARSLVRSHVRVRCLRGLEGAGPAHSHRAAPPGANACSSVPSAATSMRSNVMCAPSARPCAQHAPGLRSCPCTRTARADCRQAPVGDTCPVLLHDLGVGSSIHLHEASQDILCASASRAQHAAAAAAAGGTRRCRRARERAAAAHLALLCARGPRREVAKLTHRLMDHAAHLCPHLLAALVEACRLHSPVCKGARAAADTA